MIHHDLQPKQFHRRRGRGRGRVRRCWRRCVGRSSVSSRDGFAMYCLPHRWQASGAVRLGDLRRCMLTLRLRQQLPRSTIVLQRFDDRLDPHFLLAPAGSACFRRPPTLPSQPAPTISTGHKPSSPAKARRTGSSVFAIALTECWSECRATSGCSPSRSLPDCATRPANSSPRSTIATASKAFRSTTSKAPTTGRTT